MASDEINRRFDYQRPTGTKIQDHESVRGDVKATAEFFDFILPEGREKALALTRLQEALMWANAAIATN
jgi:hypothetical protein